MKPIPPPHGAFPRDAILAMAQYRECLELWQQIAANKRADPDYRARALYYLAVAFDVDDHKPT